MTLRQERAWVGEAQEEYQSGFNKDGGKGKRADDKVGMERNSEDLADKSINF